MATVKLYSLGRKSVIVFPLKRFFLRHFYLATNRNFVVGVAVVILFSTITLFFKSNQFDSLLTQLYDIGESGNVLWNTFQGRPFWSSVMAENYLGQHFAPGLALLGPFFLFGKTAFPLIVAQCIALAIAIPAVFILGSKVTGHPMAGTFFVGLYVLSPYVHEVLRADFHEVGVGLALTLGALAAWESKKQKWFWWITGGLFLLREDYGLYLAGFGISLLLARAAPFRIASGLAMGGMVWSGFLILFVMPSISGGVWKPAQFALGFENSGGAPLVWHFFSPEVWATFLGNPPRITAVGKLILTFGGLPLLNPTRSPAWALPLLLNALGNNPWQQRFELHYSATILPFLFWGSAHGLKYFLDFIGPLKNRLINSLPPLVGGVLLIASAVRIPKYYSETPVSRQLAARRMIDRIPPGDSVMDQTNLLPHVCRRKNVFLVPDRRPAKWFFLDNHMVQYNIPELWADQKYFVESHLDWVVDAEAGLMLLTPQKDRHSPLLSSVP